MAVPSNISFATAIDLGTIPAAYEESVFDTATSYTVYFSFTVPANTFEVYCFARGDDVASGYRPHVDIFDASQVAITGGSNSGAPSTPLQFPVTPGSYYVRVTANANVNPSNLTIELVPHKTQVITSDGGIIVPNDSTGYGATVLSPTTSDKILRFINPYPNSETGDSNLGEHPFILQQDGTGGGDVVVLSATDFSEITRFVKAGGSYGVGEEGIRTNRGLGVIYYAEADTGNPVVLHAVSYDGSRTTTTLTGLTTNVSRIAVSNDGTILYYSVHGTGAAIQRWDIVNDVALSDLAAGITNYGGSDILVLDDDTIVALTFATLPGGRVRAKRYDPDGTLRNIYDFGSGFTDFDFPAGTNPRMFYDYEPGIFWVWTHLDGGGISQFQKIDAETGEALTTLTFREYETGVYTPDGEDSVPSARFGLSFSCPAYMLPLVVEDEEQPPVIVDESVPCCPDSGTPACSCDSTPSPGGSPSSNPPSTSTGPTRPTIQDSPEPPQGERTVLDPVYWDPQCEGGGLVPIGAAPTDYENWAR